MTTQRKYGWKRDRFDHRDHFFAPAPMRWATALPAKVDLTPKMPPIWDQSDLGSCTGNGAARVLEFEATRQGEPAVTPSRLMLYYLGRMIEDTVDEDSGCQIRDVVKAAARYGACPESMWDYIPARFAERPSDGCFVEALHHRAVMYQRVPQIESSIKACLAGGVPIVFGIEVFESFESQRVAQNGIVPMPHPREKMVGGHCVVISGYDDATKRFTIDNSWGINWGIGGRCYLPYAYVLSEKLSSDFWRVTRVS